MPKGHRYRPHSQQVGVGSLLSARSPLQVASAAVDLQRSSYCIPISVSPRRYAHLYCLALDLLDLEVFSDLRLDWLFERAGCYSARHMPSIIRTIVKDLPTLSALGRDVWALPSPIQLRTKCCSMRELGAIVISAIPAHVARLL